MGRNSFVNFRSQLHETALFIFLVSQLSPSAPPCTGGELIVKRLPLIFSHAKPHALRFLEKYLLC